MAGSAPALPAPDGATRLHLIFGDPIAQAWAPGGVSRAFAARGRDAVLPPAHVPAGALDAFLRGAGAARSLNGMAAHRAAQVRRLRALRDGAGAPPRVRGRDAPRSGRLVARRRDGRVGPRRRAAGFDPANRRALLVDVGGAGSAVALALAEAGVADLALHDAAAARRDALLRTLAEAGVAKARAGSPDPAGFDLVVNATPAGVRPGDATPVPADRLEGRMFVAVSIAAPEHTPPLRAAWALGCGTRTGVGMFAARVELTADFLLGA